MEHSAATHSMCSFAHGCDDFTGEGSNMIFVHDPESLYSPYKSIKIEFYRPPNLPEFRQSNTKHPDRCAGALVQSIENRVERWCCD